MAQNTLPRDDNGVLSAYAWPGGYAIFYLDRDNSVLCPKCANRSDSDADELPNFKPIACGLVNDTEEGALICDQCSTVIA